MKKINFFAGVLAFVVGSFTTFNAQVNAYAFAQLNSSFSMISGGNVLGTAAASTGTSSLYNVSYYPVNLPFSFNFNGKLYSEIRVSTNGYVAFGGTDDATDNTPISGSENWDGAISAWGRSLNTMFGINNTTGDVRWTTTGIAPNREMVIQWSNFKPIYSTSTTNVYAFSFQIRLKETTNEISTSYSSGSYLAGSTTISGTAQIGLRGAGNSDYNNRLSSSSLAFGSSTTGISNSSTQYFSTSSSATSGMPVSGLTYTWSPPSCFTPVYSGGSTTSNSITVNWSSPLPAPSTYDLYFSTTNSAPTSITTPTFMGLSGTSHYISSLLPVTTYYVWIRSNCGSGNVSQWSLKPLVLNTQCQIPTLPTVSGATVCSGNSTVLSATGDSGSEFSWYDSVSGGNLLSTGASFTTPVLTSNTDYWVSSFTNHQSYVGPLNPNSLSSAATTAASTTYYVQFEITGNPVTINSVDVFPVASGQSSVLEVLSGPTTFTTINSINFTSSIASDGTTAQTVPVNLTLAPGTYRMRLGGSGSYYRNYTSNAVFPYVGPNFSITTGSSVASNSYYFIYNFSVTNKCESTRQQATAMVTACLGTSESNHQQEVGLYPNPFSDRLIVSNPEKVKLVKITDVSGRLYKTISNPQKEVYLQDLSKGFYIMVLEMNDGGVKTIKVIKN